MLMPGMFVKIKFACVNQLYAEVLSSYGRVGGSENHFYETKYLTFFKKLILNFLHTHPTNGVARIETCRH